MNKGLRALLTITIGLLTGLAPAAAQPPSPDLTGTWEGGWTCNTLAEGVPTVLVDDESVMKITHVSDTEVRMSNLAGLELFYSGFAVGWEGQPSKGAVTFVACQTNPNDFAYNEILSARFDTATGRLRGYSAFNERLTFVGGACKWSFTRVDTADPGVPACAGP